jgi:cytochrome c
MRHPGIAAIVILSCGSPGMAADAVEEGRALVEANCARCHALGRQGASPLAPAPPFRTLGRRYPISDLQEALGEGIMTAHPTMPEFAFQPNEIDAVIAYVQSIQEN